MVIAGPRRQHRLHEDVQLRRHAGRLHVVGQQYLPGRRGALVGAVAGREARHEIGVDRAGARAGAGRVAQRAVDAARAAEAERGDRRHQGHRRRAVRAGPLGQVLQHHSAAHAPAHQVHRRQPQRLDDGGEVVGVVAEPAGRVHRLRVGLAEPAQVHRQRPVAVRQGEHGRLPEQRRRHVAVHEQDRVAGAARRREHGHGQPAGGTRSAVMPGNSVWSAIERTSVNRPVLFLRPTRYERRVHHGAGRRGGRGDRPGRLGGAAVVRAAGCRELRAVRTGARAGVKGGVTRDASRRSGTSSPAAGRCGAARTGVPRSRRLTPACA